MRFWRIKETRPERKSRLDVCSLNWSELACYVHRNCAYALYCTMRTATRVQSINKFMYILHYITRIDGASQITLAKWWSDVTRRRTFYIFFFSENENEAKAIEEWRIKKICVFKFHIWLSRFSPLFILQFAVSANVSRWAWGGFGRGAQNKTLQFSLSFQCHGQQRQQRQHRIAVALFGWRVAFAFITRKIRECKLVLSVPAGSGKCAVGM